MLLDVKPYLINFLLLQICGNVIYAKPTTNASPNYSNATLQLSKGLQMAAYMNLELDPCNDFYNWACGHWSLSHPANEVKQKTSYVELLEDLYEKKCVEALQEPIVQDDGDDIESSSSPDSAPADAYLDNFLKSIFQSCQNTKQINVVGFAPIWDALDLHNVGWPHTTTVDYDWFETEYDWLKMVVLAKRKFNADILIGFNIVKDLQRTEINRIQLSAPQLALNDSAAYLDAERREARDDYQRYVEEKLQRFFPEMPNEWSEEIASQVMQVEVKLAKVLQNLSTDGTPPLDRYVSELKVSYGNFVDLSRYLQLMFDRTINEKVYETPKGYFRNLVDIIRLTPKLTLANYTLWKVLDKFDLGGDKEFCMQKLMHLFPREMEYFFYRHYEDLDLTRELQTAFHDVKSYLHDDLQISKRYSWILPQTMKGLREKLRAMRMEIVQPQEFVGSFQAAAIKPIKMQADQYYSNVINLLEWENEKKLLKFQQPSTSLLYNPPPLTLSSNLSFEKLLLPTYNPQTNTIQVPVKFMQTRFLWDPSYPAAIKYGTFAFLVAQQIVHGLSEDVSDSDDRKAWDFASELRFVKRSSCYAQQAAYEAKEFQGKNVTDRERLKKALMDNGGLSVAHRLYVQKVLDKETQDDLSVLPKLDITNMQQFFLAYAQVFCADYDEEVSEYGDLPEALRVNGAVANLEEFSEVFKCSDTSSLNPKEKCAIF